MYRKKQSIMAVIAAVAIGAGLLSGCNKGGEANMTTTPENITTPITTTAPEPETPLRTINIKIDASTRSPFNDGKFEGWGTSLCWWANRIGYSDSLAEQAATLFYDAQKGLGMNIARYNVGGGDDPTHDHITRTDSEVPGFLYYNEESGKFEYDIKADANQRNVLLRAMKAAGDDFIAEAFANSPPYFMTVSGCTSGSTDASSNNLKEDCFDDFAEYLAEVALIYKNEYGVDFQSISAMNEPTTNYWKANSNKQEGCHFDAGETQSTMFLELSKSLAKKGLEDILVVASDETSIDSQIQAFKKLSDEAKAVVARIDTHTYGGSQRKQLRELAVASGKNLWMSEVDSGSSLGGVAAGEMGAALFLARSIMDDMNGLLPSAWIMWQAIDNHVSAEGYNGNKDSGMPNLEGGFWGLAVADHDKDTIVLSKKYYAYGQFSRYIRPGYTILYTMSESAMAAYSEENKQLVIVAINKDSDAKIANIPLDGFVWKDGAKASVIRTSGDMATGENWAELPAVEVGAEGLSVTLKEFSITTYVIDGIEYK